MSNSVSQSRSKRAPARAPRVLDEVARVEAAFWAADDPLCETLAAHVKPASADGAVRLALVRARLAFERGAFAEARDLARRAARDAGDGSLALTATALQARASRHDGNAAEADRLLKNLAAKLRAPFDEPGQEALLLAVDDALEAHELDTAATLLDRLDARHASSASVLLARGRLDLERDEPAHAGAQFAAALHAAERTGHDDLRTFAKALAELAGVATLTLDRGLAQHAKDAFEGLAWPASLAAERSDATASLRTIALLEGRLDDAWTLAREAAALAPAGDRRAAAEIHAAETSRLIGDQAAHAIQLRRAWALSNEKAEHGADVSGETLGAFVAEAAEVLPAESRKALALARSRNEGLAGASRRDRRAAAFEDLGRARLSEASGNVGRAEQYYERAIENFIALGDRLSTALIALDLSRVGDDRYFEHAESAAALAPRAWFREEVTGNEGPLSKLTYAERGVLRELLEGKTTREIAEESNRSEYTISNHLRKVFAAFDAHSRSRVLARCREMNITTAMLDRMLR